MLLNYIYLAQTNPDLSFNERSEQVQHLPTTAVTLIDHCLVEVVRDIVTLWLAPFPSHNHDHKLDMLTRHANWFSWAIHCLIDLVTLCHLISWTINHMYSVSGESGPGEWDHFTKFPWACKLYFPFGACIFTTVNTRMHHWDPFFCISWKECPQWYSRVLLHFA